MNDDWRLQVDLHDDGFAHRLGEALRAEELEHDLQSSFADRVIVSVDGPEVFLYAGDRAQTEAAERVVRRVATDHGWELTAELRRWHPVAEIWEDPDNPEPSTPDQLDTEEEIRNAGERRESADEGYPEMEVRVNCASWREARELSSRLGDEGVVNVHRFDWVLVGANGEDDADAIAERLRGELPGADISVEANMRRAWDDAPGNPFAWLGGLAG